MQVLETLGSTFKTYGTKRVYLYLFFIVPVKNPRSIKYNWNKVPLKKQWCLCSCVRTHRTLGEPTSKALTSKLGCLCPQTYFIIFFPTFFSHLTFPLQPTLAIRRRWWLRHTHRHSPLLSDFLASRAASCGCLSQLVWLSELRSTPMWCGPQRLLWHSILHRTCPAASILPLHCTRAPLAGYRISPPHRPWPPAISCFKCFRRMFSSVSFGCCECCNGYKHMLQMYVSSYKHMF
jgi:hypothetical protein